MARGKGKKAEKVKRMYNRVYEHMLHVARDITEEPDIINMYCVLHTKEFNCGLKFVAEQTYTETQIKTIYIMYGCDEDGRALSKHPLYVGALDEIVAYLKNQSNVEEVMQFIMPNGKEQ